MIHTSKTKKYTLFLNVLVGMTFFLPLPTISQRSRPNIIIIVADDLGYGDLGCYGATDIKTPVLDKLARQGVRLTDFYSNGPECTPTRAALLTGRYQQRVGGLECAIGLGNVGRYEEAKKLSDRNELGLPVEASVLPDILLKEGYRTAIIGKWHLGDGKQYSPTAHGFEYSIGPLGGAVDYFHHTEPIGLFLGTEMKGDHDFYRNNLPHLRTGYYMTHLLTDEAVQWIDNQKRGQPFFLYLPYTTPHEPLQAPRDFQEKPLTMKDWKRGDRKTYADMVEAMDKGIGRILDKLLENGIEDDTIIIFFSDNGPTKLGSTGGLSGLKGEVREGGIRVPCIVKWPKKIVPGSVSGQPFISMDITASIAAVVGEYPFRPLDGIDLIGQLRPGSTEIKRNLFWRKKRANHIRSAVRSGNMKYIRLIDTEVFEEFLFDLVKDPKESIDLKDKLPEELTKMRMLLKKWEREVRPERI